MPSSLLSRRFAAAAALAFAVFGAASSAHARSDVTFSIGIHVPGAHVVVAPVYVPPREAHPRVYVQPRPVFVQPRPVFVQPRPVFVRPRPVFVQPRPVFVRPRPVFVQPRPVFVRPRQAFVQPPVASRHYRNGNSWRRAQWERARKHGHRDQGGKHGGRRD